MILFDSPAGQYKKRDKETRNQIEIWCSYFQRNFNFKKERFLSTKLRNKNVNLKGNNYVYFHFKKYRFKPYIGVRLVIKIFKGTKESVFPNPFM